MKNQKDRYYFLLQWTRGVLANRKTLLKEEERLLDAIINEIGTGDKTTRQLRPDEPLPKKDEAELNELAGLDVDEDYYGDAEDYRLEQRFDDDDDLAGDLLKDGF